MRRCDYCTVLLARLANRQERGGRMAPALTPGIDDKTDRLPAVATAVTSAVTDAIPAPVSGSARPVPVARCRTPVALSTLAMSAMSTATVSTAAMSAATVPTAAMSAATVPTPA